MKNPLLRRIETGYHNGDFTVRLYRIAQDFNIKTVGKLRQFCTENERVPSGYFRGRTTRRFLKELEDYIITATVH